MQFNCNYFIELIGLVLFSLHFQQRVKFKHMPELCDKFLMSSKTNKCHILIVYSTVSENPSFPQMKTITLLKFATG